MAEEYIDPNDLAELFGRTDASDFDWKDALDKVTRFFSSPQGIAGLGGAALGFADRAKPSGGGTTMAYPGAAQLTRKMVQGPYGPIAEYTGVGGGAPDYTRFTAPKVEFPTVGTTPTTTPSSSMSVQAKVDLYKQLRGYGLSDERVRRIAETMFGPQTDSDWSELTRRAGPAAEGIAGGTRGGDAGGRVGSRAGEKPTTQAPTSTPNTGGITTLPKTTPPGSRTPMGDVEKLPFFTVTEDSSANAKAADYRRLRSEGFTNAQIRDAATNVFGKQTDADWQALVNLAMPTPTGEAAQPATASGTTKIDADSFLLDPAKLGAAPAANQTPAASAAAPLATVDPTSDTFRQYNLSQEASDFLNRQNAAAGNPWEYDYRTKTFLRQGSAGPETLSYDDVMRKSRQEKVQSDIALSESRRPQRDPQEQASLDAYVKQALPNLLEDANRTGGYTPITNFLVKYGITEADINRAFGPGGLGPDFNARVQSGDIDVPIVGYRGGAFAYDRSLGMTTGPSVASTKFSVPDYVTQTYGLLGETEQKTVGQVPSWLQYYRSPSVGPEDMDRARETAAEFGRVYGREITPAELDDFIGGARSNIIQQLGFDPKDTTKYASAIAPAKEATIKKVLQDFETGRSGVVTSSDLISLGLGQYKNIRITPQEALEALNSGNPDQYIQQIARTRGMQSAIPPKSTLFGEVAGLKLTAPTREPTSKSLGGVGIGSLPDLIQYYNLNDEELGQLEQLMRSSGDEQYATQVNQLRTGTLPPPSWGHAAWQNQTTADFFGVTGTPEAENYVYQGAFKPLIEQASGLNKIGYRPSMGLAAGPEKPTAQQTAAAVVGTPFAATPAAQPARDLTSLLPSDWSNITDPSKKIDWFNQQKATQAELERAGVKPEEIAWMRQNKLGTFAGGGITQAYAHGGRVQMEDGGFVMTKRAVDGAGGPRGIQQLVPGARMIRGPGTGTSDDVLAVINGRNGQTPARLSNGEAYVPQRFVQEQGGPQRMYALMNNLQRKA